MLIRERIDPEAVANYTEANFTTYIDHYSAFDQQYNFRYFTDAQYFNNATGGPLLFYCGNEGAIEMFISSTGQMPELAKLWGGLIVFAEHRYFGKSLPFEESSFSSPFHLKFLSPHQALADFAYLITDLKTQYQISSVLAVGGSYGGMLAGWFRMKYPYLVDAALAASAPLLHFEGTVVPELYNKYITDDFRAQGEECVNEISLGFQQLSALMADQAEWAQLQSTFNTCEDIDEASTADLVYMWLYNAYEYMAMVDYPYPTGFLQPLPGNPVAAGCDAIAEQMAGNSTMWNRMVALRKAAEIYYNYDGHLQCNQIKQDYDNDLGQEGWDYLACTTLIMPIGTNGVSDMFLNRPWNLTTWNDNCYSRFESQPQVDYAQIYYGASFNYTYTMRGYSNILFSNGELDPWQSGAVMQNVSDSLVSIVIPEAAHHLDLRASNPLDPESVIWARGFEQRTIAGWLGLSMPEDDDESYKFLDN